MKLNTQRITNLLLFIGLFAAFGCSSAIETQRQGVQAGSLSAWVNLDTVKAGQFDTGKMWTFEYAPLDYFRKEYNLDVTEEWLNKVRMSALRFATYCSASFVSEDGLVMTNNHCGRESITAVSQEGENLQENGFFAATLEEERRVPDLFVEQLVIIKDVTEEIQSAINAAPDQEKIRTERMKMSEIEKREKENLGLRIQVTRLYNGGKYSMYAYKRYEDVRLVFTPETQLGYFGGDPDNFTYPRYNLDCTFFRVYDDSGKPLKTPNYFKWSEKGAIEGEAVFVVGNPGTTNRLATVAQLEFMRDIQYPRTLATVDGLIAAYEELIKANPENVEELTNDLYSFTNSRKAYGGMLDGLRDPLMMAKKKDFEKTFQSKVRSNPELNAKYGDLWDKIADSRNQLREFSNELFALSRHPLTTPQYFFVAEDLINLANELKTPENERAEEFKGTALDSTVAFLFPEDFDSQMQKFMLSAFVDKIYKNLGGDNPLVKSFTGGRKGMDAVNYILGKSEVTSKEKVIVLAKKGPDAILNSDDPFISFIINSDSRRTELQSKSTAISQQENVYSQNLGKALFEVYGTSIPPDATFTLRISDGVVKGFPYNGTVAPSVTTYYGLYDRYYSHKKEFPWNLPQKWVNPPAEFNLETPFNFVSTNDIIGGNSGSPVINKNAEVVGLAFDGNIQSLPGNFIFTTEENRTVSVHSEGMVEAIQDLYKASRLSDELRNGKITSK